MKKLVFLVFVALAITSCSWDPNGAFALLDSATSPSKSTVAPTFAPRVTETPCPERCAVASSGDTLIDLVHRLNPDVAVGFEFEVIDPDGAVYRSDTSRMWGDVDPIHPGTKVCLED